MLISSEFASDHDREYSDGAPLEPSTRIQLALGRVMTASEFVAANKLRSWGMDLVANLFREHKLDAIAGPTAGLTAPLLTPAARKTGESNTALIMSIIAVAASSANGRGSFFVNFGVRVDSTAVGSNPLRSASHR